MSLVDRNVSRQQKRTAVHKAALPHLDIRKGMPTALHTIFHAALLVLALHLVLIGIFLIMSIHVGLAGSTALYSMLAPLLLAAGLIIVLTILLVRKADPALSGVIEGTWIGRENHHRECMNDMVRAISVEAKALVIAAESVHHYEFIDEWKAHLRPSANALLAVFDKLPYETLSSFHSLFLVLSIRSQFTMLLAAGNRYAKASASIASMRSEEDGNDEAMQELIVLREAMLDKWLERMHTRHTLLSTQVNHFMASTSTQCRRMPETL